MPGSGDIQSLLSDSLTYTRDAFAGKWARCLVFLLLFLPGVLIRVVIYPKPITFTDTSLCLNAFPSGPLEIPLVILGLDFVFSFFIAGYIVRIYRGTQPAPVFTGIVDLLIDGIKISLVWLVWLLPIIIIGIAELVLGIATYYPNASPGVVLLLSALIFNHLEAVLFADIVILGVLLLFGILGVIRYARTGSMREGIRFSPVYATIRIIGWLRYLQYVFAFLVAFLIFNGIPNSLSSVPFLEGVIALVITPFFLIFSARYFTLVYEQGAGSAPTSVAPAAEQTGLLQERRKDRVSRLFEGSIRIFRKTRSLLWYSFLIGISQLVIYFLNNVFLVFPDSPGIIGKALLLTLPGTVLWLFLCFFIAVIASYVDVLLSIGVLYTAREITLGGRAGLRESLTFAAQRVRYMYRFIFISAMVFFLPRIAEPFFPGSVFTKFNFEWLLGIQIFFMVLTYFVIPICAFETEGLLASLKRSLFWFKQFWIEVSAGVLLYHLLFYLAVSALLMVYIFLLGIHLPAGTWETSLVGAGIVGITEAILGPLVQLYIFGLYSYAKNGALPSSFKVTE
jgi:hypothetical protein